MIFCKKSFWLVRIMFRSVLRQKFIWIIKSWILPLLLRFPSCGCCFPLDSFLYWEKGGSAVCSMMICCWWGIEIWTWFFYFASSWTACFCNNWVRLTGESCWSWLENLLEVLLLSCLLFAFRSKILGSVPAAYLWSLNVLSFRGSSLSRRLMKKRQ